MLLSYKSSDDGCTFPLVAHCMPGTMNCSIENGTTSGKRGSQACPCCGILNGNRAFNCKSCHRKLHEGGTKRSRSAVDVSDLFSPTDLIPKPKRFYSVRVRNRGPDYRTFVSMHTALEDMECHYTRRAQLHRMHG